MTVAEAVATEGVEGGALAGVAEAAATGRYGGRVARLRERIAEQHRLRGEPDSSLPAGVFSRLADDPDETDDIRTVDGYVSLPYAAELFEVERTRLQKALYQGRLPGVKTDGSRTASWMVKVRDVARFLARDPLQAGHGRKPKGARNLSPEERQYKAAAHELWRKRHAPWMSPEDSARLAAQVAAIASGDNVRPPGRRTAAAG